MNREVVAKELLRIARELEAIEFPNERAMRKYLEEHPDADPKNHRVKPGSPKGVTPPKLQKPPKGTNMFDAPKGGHKKAKVSKRSLVKVQNVMRAHGLNGDEDELQELAHFKSTLGQRVPEKDFGKFFVRNKAKLKKDFINNMNPSNYKNAKAFNLAKKRIAEMPISDFGKLLGAIQKEDEEETQTIKRRK